MKEENQLTDLGMKKAKKKRSNSKSKKNRMTHNDLMIPFFYLIEIDSKEQSYLFLYYLFFFGSINGYHTQQSREATWAIES